jgi:hypothetical protein
LLRPVLTELLDRPGVRQIFDFVDAELEDVLPQKQKRQLLRDIATRSALAASDERTIDLDDDAPSDRYETNLTHSSSRCI